MGSLGAMWCLVLVASAAGVWSASAAVYTVGDAAGWTIMGNVNYTAWAAKETFHVGDTVLFKYNKQFHNVMEVSKAAYDSCNASAPMKVYATGNDSITIKTAGHHYFLCGVPTHCAIGQKVEISTASSSAAPSTAPSSAPSAPTPSAPSSAPGGSSSSGTGAEPTPSPNPSNAAAPLGELSLILLISIAVAAFSTSFVGVSS